MMYDEEGVQKQHHAETLNDAELCAFIEKAFEQTKSTASYNLPYLAEARRRFAKPGRRIPVPGQPSWSEWVDEHLGITDRHVRRLLAAQREQELVAADPEKAEQQRLEAEQKKAEAAQTKAEAKLRQEAAKTLQAMLVAKAVELAELITSGDLEGAKLLASTILNAVKNSDVSLLPAVGVETPCSGCEQLHSGIAAILTSEPKKQLGDIANTCGVSTTVVRQAATRFGISPARAVEAEDDDVA